MAHELLVSCVWKGTLILLVAGLADLLLRKASAAVRSFVWSAAFLSLLLLPALAISLPPWPSKSSVVVSAPARVLSTPSRANAPRPSERAPRDWALIVWLCGATLAIVRFSAGTARVWILARRARPFAVGGLARHVPVLDAGRGATPLTWGWLRPVILLPSEARDWPSNRLRSVLLHELAHVERNDCRTLAISELSLSLYWFHPLAWWAASRLRHERERACDDCVLAAGVRASDYADDLLAVARGRNNMLPAPAMAAASNLETRLRAIFDPSARRKPVSVSGARLLTAAVILALWPLAPMRIAAQSDELSVAVYDVSGAAIPEATISVVAAGGGQPVTALSGAAGVYSFTTLPSGRYDLTITHPGFAVYVRKGVQIPGRLDAILSLGQMTESVTVSGKGSHPATAAPQRIRVGGNVQAARLLDPPKPIYPVNAESAGIDGTVLLRAVVTMEGSVSGLSVVSSPNADLTAAAMDAVRQWRYQPTLLNGKPVEVVTTVSVNFRLTP